MEHNINLSSPRQLNPKSSEPPVTSIQTYGSNTVGTSQFYNDDLKDQKKAFSAAEITSATNLHSRAAKFTDWLDARIPVDCPFRLDDPICLPAFGNDVKGKLRWVGQFPNEKGYYAAVELEGTTPGNVHCHNGIYRGYQIYQSNKENITTVSLKECQPITGVRYPTETNRQMSAQDHTPNNNGETTSWKADNSKTYKSKLYEGAKSAPAGRGQCADIELLPSHIPQEGLPFRIGERIELKSYYNAIATVRWIGQLEKNGVYWMAVEVKNPIPEELEVRCTNGLYTGYRLCYSTRNNIYTATVSCFEQFRSTGSTTTDCQGSDQHAVHKPATRDGDRPICIPDGLHYGIGDRVELLDQYGSIGTVRWIGTTYGSSPNYYMAIEMEEPMLPKLKKRCTFGESSGHLLYKSSDKNIFTTWIDRNRLNVRLLTPTANLSDKIPDQRVICEPTPPPPATEGVELPICIPDGLHYGVEDRIQLLDQYNTIGTVRWIGKFPDSHPEYYMAIEVEKPIHPELEEKCTFGWSAGCILYNSSKKNIYATPIEQNRHNVRLLTPAPSLDDQTPDQQAIHKPTSPIPATRDGDLPISIPAGLQYGVGDRIQLVDKHDAIGTVRWIGKIYASTATHFMAIQMEKPIHVELEAKCTNGVLSTGVQFCSSSQKNIYVTRIGQNVRLLLPAANTDGRKIVELNPDDASTSAGLGASGSHSHHESPPRQPARQNSTENSRFAADLLINLIPDNSALKPGDYVRIALLELVGKVKWIGVFPYSQHEHMVAIELDELIEPRIKNDCTYGSFHGYSVCSSPERNIYLTRLDQCIPFDESNRTEEKAASFDVGDLVCVRKYGNAVGNIKWIGYLRSEPTTRRVALKIVELENFELRYDCTYGDYEGQKLCYSFNRDIFVTRLVNCQLLDKGKPARKPTLKAETPFRGTVNEVVLESTTPEGSFNIGDMVTTALYPEEVGSVRWIGFIPRLGTYAAVELLDGTYAERDCCYGSFQGYRLCQSDKQNILVERVENCHPLVARQQHPKEEEKPDVVRGDIKPILSETEVLGIRKGIQGEHNSCYMDAFLFSDEIPDQRVICESTPPPPATEGVELPICIPDGLHYGVEDRIQLLDQYNTIGTVRWIGKFPDSHPEHYMAIEVEKPIHPELEEKCTFGWSAGCILYNSSKKNIYATRIEQNRHNVRLLTPAPNLDDQTPDQQAIHKPTSPIPATRDGDLPISIPAGLQYGVGDRIQLVDKHDAIGTVRWIGKIYASTATHFMAIQMEKPIHVELEAKCTNGVLSTGVRFCSSSQKNIYVTRIGQNVRLLLPAANTDGRKIVELNPDDASTSAGLGASGSHSHHESPPRQPARQNSTENSRFAADLLINLIPDNSALKPGDYVRIALLELVGKVKWIGVFPYSQHEHMVAIELDELIEPRIKNDCTYGSFHGYSVCSSPERNIYLTRLDQCIPFDESNRTEEKADDGHYENLKVESKDEHKPHEEFFPIWIPDGLNFNIGDVVMLPGRYDHEVGKVLWIGVFPEHEHEHIIPFSAAIEIFDVENFHWRDFCTHGEDLAHPDRRLCRSDHRNIFVTKVRDCKLVELAGQMHHIPKADNDFGKFPPLDQRITQPQAVAHSRSTWNYPTPELHNNKFPTGSHGTRGYGNNSWELRTPKGDLKLNPMEPGLGPIDVGDLVSLPSHHEENGTVQWMGEIPNEGLFAAIELFETGQLGGRCTDGRYHGYRLCHSDKQNIFVTRAENCVLLETTQPKKPTVRETPVEVEGDIRPMLSEAEVVGTKMGIQGEHNSCYMDASLFSMFAFSSFFDAWMLFGGVNKKHSEKRELYRDIQRTLRTTIVNPLRKNGYVKSVAVQNMRKLLDSIGLVGGLKTDEKDPEELMNLLLNDVFDVKPFMKLSNEQEMHMFHLMADADSKLPFPNIRKLLEFTFNQEKLTLAQVPDCMILHLPPRFGTEMKPYANVFPNEELDISDLLQTARQCFLCGQKAAKECLECFKEGKNGHIQEGTFCTACDVMMHQRPHRAHHHRRRIENTSDVEIRVTSSRVKLILSAVLCNERSHYVAYVRTKISGPFKWVFFDSMSDREDDQNIPKVEVIPDLDLSEDSYRKLKRCGVGSLSPLPKRLFKDAYICIYINPEIGQFR